MDNISSDALLERPYRRHWSFVVCDPRYVYPVAVAVLVAGVAIALLQRNPTYVARFGNFIIGTGVWIGMRFTLREGIQREKPPDTPVLPGPGPMYAVNSAYFNKRVFAFGDARLQLHGFALVIAGSLVSSFGDLLIARMLPSFFK